MMDKTNIVAKLSPSPKYAIFSVSKILFLSIGALILTKYLTVYLIFLFIFLLGIAFYRFLYLINIEYVITSETITITKGIIAKNINITELYRVLDYVINQSIFERIFSLMTVKLITTDVTSPELNLIGIPKSNITEVIRTLVQNARIRNKVFEVN